MNHHWAWIGVFVILGIWSAYSVMTFRTSVGRGLMLLGLVLNAFNVGFNVALHIVGAR